MKINKFQAPKSSFLSLEKDASLIIEKICTNPRIQRLLYYTSRDCLSRPNLTEEQMFEIFEKNIKLVPKLYVDKSLLNYIIISFDNFIPNKKNPEFRDNVIEFDIICHYDQWHLKDFKLRPYLIAAEIDSMLDKQHLSGIGELNFLGANQIILTNEYSGLCLLYKAIHGEEDKKYMLNPQDEERFLNDFYERFNQ